MKPLHAPLRPRTLSVALVVLGGLLTQCEKPDEGAHGAPPPPPVASATPGACSGGGGVVADPVSASFFPRTLDSYCVDPHGEVRTYGEQGKLDMDAVCTTAFDGECAVYNRFGLKRLVSLRYVDGAGGGGTVDVYLSRFADVSGAYGMYTKRVVADADPAEPTTPKVLSVGAGAAGAIGTGRAYVWKDHYLAELQYNNEQETPEALTRSSARILAALGQGIGKGLPGPSDLPVSIQALPAEHRLPNGLELVPKDALGVDKLGPLAVGYYADGATRYRLVALVASEGDAAKTNETWKVVKGRPGALPVAGVGDEAIFVSLLPPAATPDAPHKDYVFARKGPWVVGIGDEELANPAAPTKPVRLSKDEKIARLKSWLATSLPGAPKK